MGLDLIVFILAILFGILWYWRESNTNKLYRFFNKVINSKELQMKAADNTGFVFKQKFLLRFVYVAFLFLAIAIILQFLTPFKLFGSYNGVSAYFSIVVGTLIGTYIANFVIKSGRVIEEKGGSLSDMVSDVVEKGKDLIDDVTSKHTDEAEEAETEVENQTESPSPKEHQKSARERLKDKGLM